MPPVYATPSNVEPTALIGFPDTPRAQIDSVSSPKMTIAAISTALSFPFGS
jgi:hypothetical protein